MEPPAGFDHPPIAAPAPVAPGPWLPVQEHERILALDALRGVALLGIFMVNMQFFAMPFMQALHDPSLADAPASHQLARGMVRWLCEYKFISLFSLMFGMGLIVQMNRAAASGRGFVPLYLRRLVVLLAIGALHAFGLWYGDILIFYAIVGVALLVCRTVSAATMIWLAVGLLTLGAVLGLGFAALGLLGNHSMAVAPADQPSADAALRGFEAMSQAQFNPNSPVWIEGEVAAYKEGPLIDALAYRAVSYSFAAVAAILSFGWHIISMFFLGAALMKLRFFAPANHRWHKTAALVGLGLGLPIELLGALNEYWSGYKMDVMSLPFVPVHEFSSVLPMLGYVGVITLMVNSGLLLPVWWALSRVGRLALSNYLLQTITATFITYWWGLGLFNDVTRPQMIGLVLAIYLGQIVVSVLWLQVFRIGPAEWCWRSLTYMRPQAFLRRTTLAAEVPPG